MNDERKRGPAPVPRDDGPRDGDPRLGELDREGPEARAQRVILERRSRFMAAALAGLGLGAQACDNSVQPGDDGAPDAVPNVPPERPRVCLDIAPPPDPGVPPEPATPSVCLMFPAPPPAPSACLDIAPPSVCLEPEWIPIDAGIDEEDAGT